jgi:6-pyruvoyl-tetrahydropterin synthase related domain
MTSRPVIRWPMLLICAAMLVPIVQLFVGIPMVGSHRAHDGRFAVATLEQFEAELAAGNMVPRWAFTGHGGLGSPIFYFYPPGAYFVAALLGFSVPGLPTATIIGIAQVLLRAGAMLSCFAWLRRRTTTDAALTGSALYALMPYVAVLNPQVRLAFAECAAAAFVPLVFAAIDVARDRALMSVALVAPAICALAAVHLPTTVLVGGLACVYSALAGNTWLDRGSRTVATAAAVALGLGMAGWFLVPALGLLGTISAAALSDAAHSPENHFLLWHNTFRDAHGPLQGLLLDFSLVVPVAMSLLFGHAALRNHRTPWSLLGTFLVAVLLTLPLSEPLWTLRSPMREVQFPWRLLLPISLLASALVAIALPSCGTSWRRGALAAGFIATLGSIAVGIWFGDNMSRDDPRSRQQFANTAPDAVEYMPALAAGQGWFRFGQQGGNYQERAGGFVPECVKRELPSRSGYGSSGRLIFSVHGCHGLTDLPQFYFPGWAAEAGTTVLPIAPDPATGLVSVDLSSDLNLIALSRQTLGVEWIGLGMSAICLCLWLITACSALSSRRDTGATRNTTYLSLRP